MHEGKRWMNNERGWMHVWYKIKMKKAQKHVQRSTYHGAPLTVVQTVQCQFCVAAPSWQAAGTTH